MNSRSIYLCAQKKLYGDSNRESLFNFYFHINSDRKFATVLSLKEVYDYFYYPLFKNLDRSLYETYINLPKRDISDYCENVDCQPELYPTSVYYTIAFPNTDEVLKMFLEKIFFEHKIEYQWEYQIDYLY